MHPGRDASAGSSNSRLSQRTDTARNPNEQTDSGKVKERSSYMAVRQYQKGDVIFNQGDEGDVFYQIIDGSVGIFVCYDGKETVKLAEFAKGEFFGEMAVIDSAPRSASAVALDNGATVSEISAAELNDYFKDNPDKIALLMKTLSKRLRDLTADYDKAKEAAARLNVDERPDEAYLKSLKKYRFFHRNQPQQPHGAEVEREEGGKHSDGYAKNVVTYPKGTVICKQGDLVPCMYDIHWGRVGIYSNYGQPEQVLLTTLAANNFFGEMGMVDNAPRSATAVALDDDTTVEIIHPDDFAELFEKNPYKVDMILKHLSNRLRKLTAEYYEVCGKIAEKTGSNA